MSSRNPMPRPRRVAGQGKARGADADPTLVEVPRGTSGLETPAAEAPAEPPEPEPVETPAADAPGDPGDAAPSSRLTLLLVVAILVLALVAMVLTAYLWGPLNDEPQVSAETPIITEEVTYRSAVEAASSAAVKFTSRSYETYDEQVDAATATMTDAFAEEYRTTTDEIKDDFVAAETVVTAEVVAQSVRTASDEQVEALLFLNQFTSKNGEEGVFTPFRVLVTMVKTDQGWLVSDVETA